MKGMGVLMDNERPVVRFMAQHWPLTLITGYALYRRLNKRRKDKSLSAFTALTDTGMALSPLAAIALISVAATKRQVQSLPPNIKALPAPSASPQVNGFAGDVPPPAFFATRPPHEVNAHVPAAAEEVITAPGAPPAAEGGASGGSGMFDSFLS
jgi:hypothetical protein